MRNRGFTMMELLLVLMLVALLASVAAPMVTTSIERAKVSTLKENLFVLRKAIDDYYADNGQYPEDLQVLVSKRYIRHIPEDPLTDSVSSWILIRDKNGEGNIMDIRSGSNGKARDGTPYATL
ncbi:MAG: type II secretion system protein GspG [Gammaproteobacteria bacterium]|nr:type II secretion system protein GspG [Gammaproteobacteria bacterium]